MGHALHRRETFGLLWNIAFLNVPSFKCIFLIPSNVQDEREMLKMSASHVQGIFQNKNMNIISTHNIMQ